MTYVVSFTLRLIAPTFTHTFHSDLGFAFLISGMMQKETLKWDAAKNYAHIISDFSLQKGPRSVFEAQ